MVEISEALSCVSCSRCGVMQATTRIRAIEYGTTTNTISLCERCRLKLARELAPSKQPEFTTQNDVAKILTSKVDNLKDDLRKMVQSLLHAERTRTNQLVETTAANLRATIEARFSPAATPPVICGKTFTVGRSAVWCAKQKGHEGGHMGMLGGEPYHWYSRAGA